MSPQTLLDTVIKHCIMFEYVKIKKLVTDLNIHNKQGIFHHGLKWQTCLTLTVVIQYLNTI